MSLLKILKCFRLAFVLSAASLIAVIAYASFESYRGINSLVVNRTKENWRFGFNSMVKSNGREVLFRGSAFPFPIKPGESFPLGREEERDQIIGIYVETGGLKKNVPCPANFSFYQIEISTTGVRCEGTNSRIFRWWANLPVTPVFLKSYARAIQELTVPEV